MSLGSLPTELLLIVGRYANIQSLHCLALTCRRFYVALDPILWARIDPTPIQFSGLYSENFKAYSILSYATGTDNIAMAKKLIANYPDFIEKETKSPTFTAFPVYNPVIRGHKEFVELLLRNGFPATPRILGIYQKEHYVSPLMMALKKRHFDLARLILDYNPLELDLRLAATVAANRGAIEILGLILDKMPDVDKIQEDGMAMIHDSIIAKRKPMLDALLDRGADINLRNRDGNTPLHLAVLDKLPDTLRYLLARGADPNVLNDEGVTPLALATNHDQDEEVEILRSHGA